MKLFTWIFIVSTFVVWFNFVRPLQTLCERELVGKRRQSRGMTLTVGSVCHSPHWRWPLTALLSPHSLPFVPNLSDLSPPPGRHMPPFLCLGRTLPYSIGSQNLLIFKSQVKCQQFRRVLLLSACFYRSQIFPPWHLLLKFWFFLLDNHHLLLKTFFSSCVPIYSRTKSQPVFTYNVNWRLALSPLRLPIP